MIAHVVWMDNEILKKNCTVHTFFLTTRESTFDGLHEQLAWASMSANIVKPPVGLDIIILSWMVYTFISTIMEILGDAHFAWSCM